MKSLRSSGGETKLKNPLSLFLELLLAISVLLTRLGHLKGLPGVLFTLSAIPIAVVANMIRIAGAGILGSMNPDLAEGFFHLFSGWVVFVFAFLSLILEIRLFQRFRRIPDVA